MAAGLVQAPRHPVIGRDQVAKLVASGVRRLHGLWFEPATVNGRAGGLALDGDGNVVGVIALTSYGSRFRTIDVLGNATPCRYSRLIVPLAWSVQLLKAAP
jgi:hypothetical protein